MDVSSNGNHGNPPSLDALSLAASKGSTAHKLDKSCLPSKPCNLRWVFSGVLDSFPTSASAEMDSTDAIRVGPREEKPISRDTHHRRLATASRQGNLPILCSGNPKDTHVSVSKGESLGAVTDFKVRCTTRGFRDVHGP